MCRNVPSRAFLELHRTELSTVLGSFDTPKIQWSALRGGFYRGSFGWKLSNLRVESGGVLMLGSIIEFSNCERLKSYYFTVQ